MMNATIDKMQDNNYFGNKLLSLSCKAFAIRKCMEMAAFIRIYYNTLKKEYIKKLLEVIRGL